MEDGEIFQVHRYRGTVLGQRTGVSQRSIYTAEQ
jgi:hypothetical protein